MAGMGFHPKEDFMKVAILGERSGIVRDAFIRHGHDAISCDFYPTEVPGPHIEGNFFSFNWSGYDLIIAHPDCTYMAVSGNRYYSNTPERLQAAEDIKRIWFLPVPRLCIENPVGQINTYLPFMPKPQYIQPWQFGHDASKKTGLWLRGLPKLVPTDIIKKSRYANQTPSGQNKLGPSPDRAYLRAKTYLGIAEAMATQWGNIEENSHD